MSVCCERCTLSGRGLCDELIAHPYKSYRLWRVVMCDVETSWMRRPWPSGGCCAKNKNKEDRTWISKLHIPSLLKTKQYLTRSHQGQTLHTVGCTQLPLTVRCYRCAGKPFHRTVGTPTRSMVVSRQNQALWETSLLDTAEFRKRTEWNACVLTHCRRNATPK
jgi:hypothetical protein